jgi:hypothetical protein
MAMMSSEMAKKLAEAREKNPNPSTTNSSSEEKPQAPSKTTEPAAQAGAESSKKAPSRSSHTHPTQIQNLRYHVCRIIDKSKDPSQVFPFLVDCSCGWQSRVHTKEIAEETANFHVARRGYLETPK